VSAPPELSLDLVVGLDYGQFYLYPSPPEHDFAEVPNVVDRAISDGGIAQAGMFLVVLSPHQNNFELALRVEVFAGEPADDLDNWPEAFLATVVAVTTALYTNPRRCNMFRSPYRHERTSLGSPGAVSSHVVGRARPRPATSGGYSFGQVMASRHPDGLRSWSGP